MQRKKYEDALESFNHVIEKDKNNLSTLTNLGHCYYFLKRFDEAEQTYLKAI
jgi:Flp pilus assembly protein TadD